MPLYSNGLISNIRRRFNVERSTSLRTTCTASPEQIEVMELVAYSRPTYNKLVHSATTRSTVVRVIHKLSVTNTPTTCCGEFSKSTM